MCSILKEHVLHRFGVGVASCCSRGGSLLYLTRSQSYVHRLHTQTEEKALIRRTVSRPSAAATHARATRARGERTALRASFRKHFSTVVSRTPRKKISAAYACVRHCCALHSYSYSTQHAADAVNVNTGKGHSTHSLSLHVSGRELRVEPVHPRHHEQLQRRSSLRGAGYKQRAPGRAAAAKAFILNVDVFV